MPFFAGKTVLNAALWVIGRKRFDFDRLTLHLNVTLSKVNIAYSTLSGSGYISGSDYSDFEALREGEHNERVYEYIGEIRPWQFEPSGQS